MMSPHVQIYQKFIKEYILNHSPLQVNDLVKVRGFHPQLEYQVSRVAVDSEGEFSFEVISPQTHSVLPMLLRYENLEKIEKI